MLHPGCYWNHYIPPTHGSLEKNINSCKHSNSCVYINIESISPTHQICALPLDQWLSQGQCLQLEPMPLVKPPAISGSPHSRKEVLQ